MGGCSDHRTRGARSGPRAHGQPPGTHSRRSRLASRRSGGWAVQPPPVEGRANQCVDEAVVLLTVVRPKKQTLAPGYSTLALHRNLAITSLVRACFPTCRKQSYLSTFVFSDGLLAQYEHPSGRRTFLRSEDM